MDTYTLNLRDALSPLVARMSEVVEEHIPEAEGRYLHYEKLARNWDGCNRDTEEYVAASEEFDDGRKAALEDGQRHLWELHDLVRKIVQIDPQFTEAALGSLSVRQMFPDVCRDVSMSSLDCSTNKGV